MRTLPPLLALVLFAGASAVHAQRATGTKEKEDPMNRAKVGRYLDRWADEVRAKKHMEEGRVALHTKAFREALHNYTPGKLPALNVTWGEFVSKSGTVFVAVQLAPSSETFMKPDTKVTAFGELVDGAGKPQIDFEEPVPVEQSKGDVFVERTFFLPGHSVTGTFGVAVGDEILALGRSDITFDELTRTSPGLSKLIVSNNVYNLPQIQNPFDPFSFGGTKVVPKPDRAFHPADELWLFAELRNPEIGADHAPKVTSVVEIEGATRKLRVPAQIDATPLKGVDGHFGLGTTVDLSKLKPGDYKVRLTITDTLANRVFQREETIKVVD